MTGKTIFLKGMFCCLVVALGAMLLDLGKNIIFWYEWRSQGTEPIMIVGKLSKLVSLEGKKKGKQQLEISTVNENFLLSTNLSPKQIQKVRSLNHEINISFIPSPFGIPKITELSSLNNHTIYYEKK